MATNKSTSRVRPRRASSTAAADLFERGIPPVSATDELRDAIEEERTRLMTAEALLHCIAAAMNEHEREPAHDPHYQVLIELTRDLVRQSIDRLDSMRLRPLLKNVQRASHEVKEEISAYVH